MHQQSLLEVKDAEAPISRFQPTKSRSLLRGLLTLTSGLIILFTQSIFIEYITTSFFTLSSHSLLKKIWEKPPVSALNEIYLFNWTNPEEFYDTSIKPKFQEVGPFRFLMNIEKVNLTWHENDTVTFKQIKTFYIDDQEPNGNFSAEFTTLNILTAVLADTIEDWHIMLKKTISFVVDLVSPNIYLTKTAKEYLYEGIQDFLIDFADTFTFVFDHMPRFEKVAIVTLRNNSADFDGIFNMATGAQRHFNVLRWNHKTKTSYFKNYCGQVDGTLGELHGRNLAKDYIILFVPELCRHVKFDYEKETTVKGILGYKYAIGKSILDNGTVVAENKCFCGKKCIPSGVISGSSCRYGAPVYVSLPHFYLADPVYLNAVEGLIPKESDHEGYIIIEPTTGITLKVSVGMQLNFLVHPVEGIDAYENVRTIFFPTFWVKESITIPNHWALALKTYLCLPWILLGLSIGLICWGLYFVLVMGKLIWPRCLLPFQVILA